MSVSKWTIALLIVIHPALFLHLLSPSSEQEVECQEDYQYSTENTERNARLGSGTGLAAAGRGT